MGRSFFSLEPSQWQGNVPPPSTSERPDEPPFESFCLLTGLFSRVQIAMPVLRESALTAECVIHYGPDEFLILLAGGDPQRGPRVFRPLLEQVVR